MNGVPRTLSTNDELRKVPTSCLGRRLYLPTRFLKSRLHIAKPFRYT
jgi:hypothetical protein